MTKNVRTFGIRILRSMSAVPSAKKYLVRKLWCGMKSRGYLPLENIKIDLEYDPSLRAHIMRARGDYIYLGKRKVRDRKHSGLRKEIREEHYRFLQRDIGCASS